MLLLGDVLASGAADSLGCLLYASCIEQVGLLATGYSSQGVVNALYAFG